VSTFFLRPPRHASHHGPVLGWAEQAAQRMIGSLELDVLVFGEVGMDALTYFLAFARLARVQTAFWGHAVTTGISPLDDDGAPEGLVRGRAERSGA
jgi:hypothetical protein